MDGTLPKFNFLKDKQILYLGEFFVTSFLIKNKYLYFYDFLETRLSVLKLAEVERLSKNNSI
jgi:hypothetical protein